jgi:actin-related protein 5
LTLILLIQWIFQNLCEFSPDYTTLLRKLKNPAELRAQDKIIQFPFSAPVESEKTEEELARAAERRREQGKKLQEIAAAKRLEKVRSRSSTC